MSRCLQTNASAESDGQIVVGQTDVDCSNNLALGLSNNGSVELSLPVHGSVDASVVGESQNSESDADKKRKRNYERRQRKKENKKLAIAEKQVEIAREKIEARISKEQAIAAVSALEKSQQALGELGASYSARLSTEVERGQQLAEQILAFQRQQTADQIQLSILQNALAVNPLAADVREKNREIEKLQGVIADRDQSIQSLTSKNLQLVVRVGSLQKAAATHQPSERVLGSTLTERDLKLWIEQSSGSKP